jgi:hypothetical protein
VPAEFTGYTADLMEVLLDPNVNITAHLAVNDFTDRTTEVGLADLVEADFPGYSQTRLESWTALPPYDDDIGEAQHPPAEFVAGELVDPQAVTVFYLTVQIGAETPRLLGICVFDTFELVVAAGQKLEFVPTLHCVTLSE